MGVAKRKRNRKKVRQKKPKTHAKIQSCKIVEYIPKLRELWDPKLSVRQNYKKIGMAETYNVSNRETLFQEENQTTDDITEEDKITNEVIEDSEEKDVISGLYMVICD
jgi:hypothetical protein